jgi:phosphatidylserine/phosphatidylglycerophosphate/cardiolipin synthase-like enzyme
MRATESANGITVKAYAGSTGVLLGFNVTEKRRKGLLGFAVERKLDGKKGFLQSALHFPGVEAPAGSLLSTAQSPVQKFRWSDYRVMPGQKLEYTVHPIYGEPKQIDIQDGPTVRIQTAGIDLKGDSVLFNRAAAASQAFSRRFPEVEEALKKAKDKKTVELPPAAKDWLTRGVRGQITGFIGKATGAGFALDIAIYEYELSDIVDAVNHAADIGVEVRVVYHAKKDDEQTTLNEENLAHLSASAKRARVTSKICHHKFIVLSKVTGGKRKPVAVLCGSTNFTENGVYRQANVVHVLNNAAAASKYAELFEFLFAGNDPAATRKRNTDLNPMPTADEPMFIGFSPRSGETDLDYFVSQINRAKNDLLFATAFQLPAKITTALLGAAHDPVLRFGVQNTASEITGVHADRTALFTAAALLPSGLEGWQKAWLKESKAGQSGNILIHTKIVVVNFTSDDPIIISGSHNLSVPASNGNDENYLIFHGNTDVADCYGVEVMRIYDHYRFRFATKQKGKSAKPPMLTPDDSWTNRYFEKDSLPFRDRIRFSGRKG